MKRLTASILTAVLALSLLASCGGDAPKISDAPGSDPAAAANYLADPMFDTDEYLPDYDADNRFLRTGTQLVETDNTYYLIPRIGYIMFVDKQSLLCGPLCGKPECAHNDTSCNAYAANSHLLSRYNGQLYFISDDEEHLYKMNLDGTNREQVMKLGPPSYMDDSGGSERVGSTVNYKVSLHRGYVYRTWMEDVVSDGVPGVRMYAESIKADSGERTAIFDRTYSGNNAVDDYQIRFSGNRLYMMVKKYTAETRSFELYDWDSKTRSLTVLADGDISASDFWVGDDGYIYIGCKDSSLADNPNVIYRFTPEGRTLEIYRGFETQPSLMGDGVLFLAPARSDIDSGKSVYTATFSDWDGNVLFYGSILPDGVSNENMVCELSS